MAKKRRKLTPTQRRRALKNLAKARAARKSKTIGRAKRGKGSLVIVAPKKRKRTMAAKKRRRRAAPKKRRSSSRRGGGGRGGLMSGIEWMDMGGAGAYGLLEKQVAEKGDEAYLKKVPLFFEGIGYAGCSAILAHIIGKNVGGIVGKAARHYARGTFSVAAYKLAKNGKLYESKAEAEAALAGDDDDLGADDDEFAVGLDDDEVSGDDDEVGYGADGIS